MKIGLIAYSTNTGLGYQTRSLAKHLKPHAILVIDISQYNKMPVDHSWANPYNSEQLVRFCVGFPSNEDVEWLADNSDLVFYCETPLNFHLLEYARTKGVRTINQYNYEFLDYVTKPALPMPTALAAPTTWQFEEAGKVHGHVLPLPVPVDLSDKAPKYSKHVKTLIHIAGNMAVYDRNGTIQFLQMIQYLEANHDFKLTYKLFIQTHQKTGKTELYSQVYEEINKCQQLIGDRLQVIVNVNNNNDMYKDGELMILPRKYGGLCLPMWEALAYGIPVLMPDVSPNHDYLPSSWLYPAEYVGMTATTGRSPIFQSNPIQIAEVVINAIANIEEMSKEAREIAVKNSWEKQMNTYSNLFRQVCEL